MIAGTIVLEDVALTFTCRTIVATDGSERLVATYTVTDLPTGETETLEVPQADFLAALAIALHNDGTPDWQKDYPAAETVMGNIRWIP